MQKKSMRPFCREFPRQHNNKTIELKLVGTRNGTPPSGCTYLCSNLHQQSLNFITGNKKI